MPISAPNLRGKSRDLLLVGGAFLLGFSLSLLAAHYGRVFRIQSALSRWSQGGLQENIDRYIFDGRSYHPRAQYGEFGWLLDVARVLNVNREGELEVMRSQLDSLRNPEVQLMNLAAIAICGAIGVAMLLVRSALRSQVLRQEPWGAVGRLVVILTIFSSFALSGVITMAEVDLRVTVPPSQSAGAVERASISLRRGVQSLADNPLMSFSKENRLAGLVAADLCIAEISKQADYLPLLLRLRVASETRRYCRGLKMGSGDDLESFLAELRRILEAASRITEDVGL